MFRERRIGPEWPNPPPSPLFTGQLRLSWTPAERPAQALNDDALPNGVKDDLRRVVQIELLHQIGPVGLDG